MATMQYCCDRDCGDYMDDPELDRMEKAIASLKEQQKVGFAIFLEEKIELNELKIRLIQELLAT